ncbi:S-adenosyl-L-methionine-dependent methyltransferase [Syncephalis fuscata]|nr:S-adenosyl-L-methionine-dependent methyltransferase [Syncephalis fuscata]
MSNDTWSPTLYQKHAGFVARETQRIVSLLELKPSDTLLDVGCGDGVLTLELQKACNRVVGIDSSARMIESAQQLGIMDARVAELTNPTIVADDDIGQFDKIFSNACFHWIKQKDQSKLINNLWEYLKPSGRLVFEMGGHQNIAALHMALIDTLNDMGHDGEAYSPWYFPTAETYTALLETHGFHVLHSELEPAIRHCPPGESIGGWIDTFAASFYSACRDDAERQEFRNRCIERLRPVLQDEHGHWHIVYVRLRIVAEKQSK